MSAEGPKRKEGAEGEGADVPLRCEAEEAALLVSAMMARLDWRVQPASHPKARHSRGLVDSACVVQVALLSCDLRLRSGGTLKLLSCEAYAVYALTIGVRARRAPGLRSAGPTVA